MEALTFQVARAHDPSKKKFQLPKSQEKQLILKGPSPTLETKQKKNAKLSMKHWLRRSSLRGLSLTRHRPLWKERGACAGPLWAQGGVKSGWCEVHRALLSPPSRPHTVVISACDLLLAELSGFFLFFLKGLTNVPPPPCFHAGPLDSRAFRGTGWMLTQSCCTAARKSHSISNQDRGWWCYFCCLLFYLLSFVACFACVCNVQ